MIKPLFFLLRKFVGGNYLSLNFLINGIGRSGKIKNGGIVYVILKIKINHLISTVYD
jgi:hypothetical protein